MKSLISAVAIRAVKWKILIRLCSARFLGSSAPWHGNNVARFSAWLRGVLGVKLKAERERELDEKVAEDRRRAIAWEEYRSKAALLYKFDYGVGRALSNLYGLGNDISEDLISEGLSPACFADVRRKVFSMAHVLYPDVRETAQLYHYGPGWEPTEEDWKQLTSRGKNSLPASSRG